MFYKVENRTDKEMGNVFPQVSCYSQNLAHSIEFDELTNLDWEILYQLEPKAKLTDVLSQASISAHGLLINDKVRNLFQEFNLMKHRYYKCLVKDKNGNGHNYYWLHLVDDFSRKIDYSKSVFYWTDCGYREDTITLNSYEDYLSKKKNNGITWGVDIEKIVLNETFDNSLDLFSCIPFDMGVYVSDALKERIEQENVLGIEIKNTNIKFLGNEHK